MRQILSLSEVIVNRRTLFKNTFLPEKIDLLKDKKQMIYKKRNKYPFVRDTMALLRTSKNGDPRPADRKGIQKPAGSLQNQSFQKFLTKSSFYANFLLFFLYNQLRKVLWPVV